MEYWDLYDKNRKPLNKIHKRGLPMQDDEYHIVVSIATINNKNEILITHRDPRKEMYPDMWEITVGSALSGESSECAALRELLEETGIQANPSELILVDTITSRTKGRFSFNDIYFVKKDIKLSELTMQEGETTEARWVTFLQFNKMAENNQIAKSSIKRFDVIRNFLMDK